ncbi:MAG: hypothetical protein ACI9LN_003989, partial [Saprospiraceae bacterium]
MKKVLFSTLCLLVWQVASAQMPTVEEILKEQKEKKNRVNERDADTYVVDSVYCFLHSPASGIDNPVNRAYNLGFTAEGLVFESLEQNYDADNQIWINNRHTINTYDGNDGLVETINEIWDGAGWINDSRMLNGLNNDGDIESIINQVWNGSDWENTSRVTFTYNASGDNDKLLNDLWEDNDWEPDFQFFYAYNTEGLLIASIFQKWDSNLGNYANINRVFRSYFTGTELISEETAEIWDVNLSTPDWLESSRLTFEYDGDGNQLSRLRESWSTAEEIYVNAELMEEGYDSEGDNVSSIMKIWQAEEWVNQGKIDREFDEASNLTAFYFSFWSGTDWIEASHCDFFYTLTIVDNVTEVAQNLDCKMPNPFGNGQAILCKNMPQNEAFDLIIYNLNGKMMTAQPFNNQLDVSNFSKGIYFFTIENKGNIVFREKVIV